MPKPFRLSSSWKSKNENRSNDKLACRMVCGCRFLTYFSLKSQSLFTVLILKTETENYYYFTSNKSISLFVLITLGLEILKLFQVDVVVIS
jgi:hypothetical protein